MWVNIHQSYHAIERINQKTVWSAIVLLFFSSFYPYATKLIADAFRNKVVQGLYGVVVLLITFAVLVYYKQLDGEKQDHTEKLMLHKQKWIWIDMALKLLGLILSVTVFPPATSIAVLLTLLVLVIPNQLKPDKTSNG